MSNTVNVDKKVKDVNMNIKFPEADYRELQIIADNLGGMTLSSMVRVLIYAQLDKVKKMKDPKSFLEIRNIKKPVKAIKNMNMNVKLPKEDYLVLQDISVKLGGMTLSSMIRMLINAQLEKVRKTNDPKSFLEISQK